MRIDLPPGPPTLPARALASTQGWLLGQLLNVSVIGRVDHSSIRIAIAGMEAVAKTDLELAPGTALKVRVAALGPQPQLAIVDPAPVPKQAPVGVASTVASALKHTLPAQEPIDEVLNRLTLTVPGADSAPAVQRVEAKIAQLVTLLPTLPALARPEELRRALVLSGPQLESSLAAWSVAPEAAPPAQDLKLQLLALRQLIDGQLMRSGDQPSLQTGGALPRPQDPGAAGSAHAAEADLDEATLSALRNLAADVDAGLARVTTHQLQHAAATARGELFAFTEIPYRTEHGIDTLDIEVEADAQGRDHEGETALELSLALSLPSLGEFRARIGLRGDHLAVTLWSEASALREMIVDRVDELQRSLSAAGFELSPVSLRAIDAPKPLRHLQAGLVDTRI